MIETENDKLFRAVHGDTFFDCTTPQFSEQDLANILFPETMLKLGNWIQAGYVKPDYWKDPRGGKDKRRYSIVEIFRIGLIDSLVNGIGIKPSHAVEVVDFVIPFFNDIFDRHPDRELKSKAALYVMSWLDRRTGHMVSNVLYVKPDDAAGTYYEDDPYLNPDAKPLRSPGGTSILLPVTDLFYGLFLNCAKYLAMRNRGMTDKWGRPIENA
jgi:hypothetical protein